VFRDLSPEKTNSAFTRFRKRKVMNPAGRGRQGWGSELGIGGGGLLQTGSDHLNLQKDIITLQVQSKSIHQTENFLERTNAGWKKNGFTL
jgi:hypothetical protein